MIANAEQYHKLKNDPDYHDVGFDWKTGGGGVKATHKEHKEHPNDDNRYFTEQLNGDQLEREFMDKAFHLGHSVIFRAEANNDVDLDMYLDNELMDLISPTANSEHYRNQLKRKNNQLSDYNASHEKKSHSVCMYFHDPNYYSYDKVKIGLEKIGEVSRIDVEINTVYILKNDGTDIIKLDFP